MTMRKIISLLSFLCMFTMLSKVPLLAQEITISEVAEWAKASLVNISCYNRKAEMGSWGTGFFIAPGKILTNAHVMDFLYSAEVSSKKNYYENVTILKIDEFRDLALLEVEALPGECFLPIEKEDEVKPNQSIVSLGYPELAEAILSEGVVVKNEYFDGFHKIQISAPIFSGMSGGPVLNLEGRVIGINYRGRPYVRNDSFAIGFKTINEFLNRPDNPKKLHRAGSCVFWVKILYWIDEFAETTGAGIVEIFLDFIFIQGRAQGVAILILSCSLIGWMSIRLYTSRKAGISKSTLRFYCWKCGKKIRVDLGEGKESAECKKCKTTLSVPEISISAGALNEALKLKV